jgi:hypothetical protein
VIGKLRDVRDRHLSHYFIQLDPNIFDVPKYPKYCGQSRKGNKKFGAMDEGK